MSQYFVSVVSLYDNNLLIVIVLLLTQVKNQHRIQLCCWHQWEESDIEIAYVSEYFQSFSDIICCLRAVFYEFLLAYAKLILHAISIIRTSKLSITTKTKESNWSSQNWRQEIAYLIYGQEIRKKYNKNRHMYINYLTA